MIETNTIKIANYQALELIHESSRTEVYRGQNVENGQSVIIKLMRNQYPSFRELVQFRNQYAISKNLEIEGIIKTYTLQRYENRYALIMEDVGGISLAEYEGKSSFSIPQFLDIAIQLAEILHQLHKNSIIHKDIKPANILIHPETKQVKLIDFSISTLLPKETQAVQTPNVLEGTLAYLSPEQTGRMNRGIDYRSDFYALGVTFYELLMGALPFNSDDALELIHAHIALPPKPLTALALLEIDLCPKPISDIVMKLMAKNAEERYQSALGLKYDLEKCLIKYRESGKIEGFELGERDICDRFVIPEKLYGREKEVQALLDAFERVVHPPQTPLSKGRAEMMLVAGYSGIGKTAIVNEVHKPILRQRGYFIKGKFDQFNRNIPFSAFLQAFRSLIGQLLGESDTKLQEWKTQILEAVGANGQILIDVIPELESLIGRQPAIPELSGSAAQNRFNLLFQKFIAIFTTKEHPLVIFLDDLQWADSASLNLMKVLMRDNETGYLLLLGAYRDNEVFPTHPLILTLAELEKRCDPTEVSSAKERAPREQEAAISTIILAPLAQHHINRLVAKTLNCSIELALPLTELIYSKTQGNPFFTTQFLKGLYHDELIVFNRYLGYWECDLVKVRDAALTDDVVEFIARRLQKLPEATQEVLKLAACIGNQFDLETLTIAREISSEEVAAELWPALQEGIILPISEAYKFFQGEINSAEAKTVAVNYRFLHDRVQQAAYFLIPEDTKQATHYQIGQQFLARLSTTEREERIFDIVNQINIGQSLLVEETEKKQLAELNLKAGHKAKAATAYEAAKNYFHIGINLLERNKRDSLYEIVFELHLNLAETELMTADFDALEKSISASFNLANSPVDQAKIYVIKINQYSLQGLYIEAIETSLQGLNCLGVDVNRDTVKKIVEEDLCYLDQTLENIPIESLLDLPVGNNSEIKATIELLMNVLSAAYNVSDVDLYTFTVARNVRLSIEYGNIPKSVAGYVNYAWLLGIAKKQYQRAAKFADLALQLSYKLNSKSQQSGACFLLGTGIHCWSRPIEGAAEINYEGFLAGMDSGELQYAGYNLFANILNRLFKGENLANIVADIDKYWSIAEKIHNDLALSILAACRFCIDKLFQTPENQNGEVLSREEIAWIERHKASQSHLPLGIYYICQMQEAFLSQNLDRGIDYEIEARKFQAAWAGSVGSINYYYYGSLNLWAIYDKFNQTERKNALEKIAENQEQLKIFSDSCPENFLHKYLLIEAEQYRVLDNKIKAIELYDRAIAGAKENGYIQEEALANELAAKFYLNWGKEKFAALHMQEAYYCYAQWGAKAKNNDLEQRYPQLLKPILQRNTWLGDRQSVSASNSLSPITNSSQTQTTTINNISSILDFSSLLKASQTLSEEIELDRLLSTVMKIILENAGATKGALLLTNETGLTIEAIATRTEDSTQLTIDSLNQSIPLEESIDLPVGLINYVRRTTETVLLDGKATQEQFAADRYLLRFHPQSLLCMPLLERGKLIGILYLENSLTADAFTSERVEILDTLCAQAAISLENARLYQQAQQALKDLQEAQLQLVQSEKMATLGNLVAGVAHEINNPVGFIDGNINTAREYVQDLLQALSLYQENTSPSESVITELEDLDIDFIAEDFPKLITSMQAGCVRISNISKSLRTFSRKDTTSKTEFNLHDGIDSTLLILKYRLKANQNRPAIEVVKNYGDIPLVKCYAGQLNQVFMNLLANAIDALDESNEGKVFEEIEKRPNCITISTELSNFDNSVIVQISDNGTGMSEEVKAKIFQQGFTTKGVGKGTGLGMAITHQIITEKHGGKISCDSIVGQGTIFTIMIPRYSPTRKLEVRNQESYHVR